MTQSVADVRVTCIAKYNGIYRSSDAKFESHVCMGSDLVAVHVHLTLNDICKS